MIRVYGFVQQNAVQWSIKTLRQARTVAQTTRNSRLDLRIAPEEKELIERAASLTGTNTADFIRSTTLAAAREAIRVHEVIKLTAEGSRAFVEALIDPPPPNEHLRTLAQECAEELGL
jgi:uncharacterized protein (DUF1778 family)